MVKPKSTLQFVGVCILLSGGFIAANDLSSQLPTSWFSTLLGFVLLALFIWIFFDLIVRIIYRTAGVAGRPKGSESKFARPTHQQAAKINRLWTIWLFTTILTVIAYSLAFNRGHIKEAIIFGLIVSLITYLGISSTKRKIMGHRKEELFK
jgi:hypothetical protein